VPPRASRTAMPSDGAPAAPALPVLRRIARLGGTGGVTLACVRAEAYVLAAGEDLEVHLYNVADAVSQAMQSPSRSQQLPKAAGARDDEAHLPQARHVHSFAGPQRFAIEALALASSHSRLVCGGRDRAANVWDIARASLHRSLTGHTEPLRALAFAGEGDSLVLTGSSDRSLRIYDLRSSHKDGLVQALDNFADTVSSVQAHGARIIAGCADGTVHTFDARKGRELVDAIGPSVGDIALSANGRQALVACVGGAGAGALGLLDTVDGRLIRTFRGHKNKENRIHCDFVGLATPNGLAQEDCNAYVATGSETGTVHVWDRTTGQALATPDVVHRQSISALACGEGTIVSCSYDGAGWLWQLEPQQASTPAPPARLPKSEL